MLKSSAWAVHLPEFANWVAATEPTTLLELGCGACLGTQAVVESCTSFERLFAVDIDLACAKTAEGLFTYLGQTGRVDPVVGSFWSLPIKAGAIDTVFSHYGLDEARDIERVLAEVARVLRPGGRFVPASPVVPSLMLPVFDEAGFSTAERGDLAAMAGLYAGPDWLCQIASGAGLRLVCMRSIAPPDGHKRVLFLLEA